MSAAKLIDTHKNGAEIYQGDTCKNTTLKFLTELRMPKDLLPLEEVDEIGINRTSGFVWLRLKRKITETKFKAIGCTVIYAAEVSASFEAGHMFKLTGVKAKELLMPVAINDILVGELEPGPGLIKFTSAVGLSRSYPVSAFELSIENGMD